MAEKIYRIQASWDPEAGVWVAESEDVPGLATEADTVERLTEKLRVMIPELLEAIPPPPEPISPIDFPRVHTLG